jgi:hypothetical protein
MPLSLIVSGWRRPGSAVLPDIHGTSARRIPEAADEYDCMISPLLHRLFEGADTRSPADWISRERTSHFGAGPNDARDMRLAESLTAWWERRRAEAS